MAVPLVDGVRALARGAWHRVRAAFEPLVRFERRGRLYDCGHGVGCDCDGCWWSRYQDRTW